MLKKILLISVLSVSAYHCAVAQSAFANASPPSSSQSLIRVLNQLERKFDISFAYQRKHLVGKTAIYREVSRQELISYLSDILAPLNLVCDPLDEVRQNIFVITEREDISKTRTQVDSVRSKPTVARRWVFGTITTATQLTPVEGANVVLKNSSRGTVTDKYGNFLMEIPNGSQPTIVVSCIGYETREVAVQHDNPLQISMQESVGSLSEVVVTAMGIDRAEKGLGYAINMINSHQIVSVGNTNMNSALYGKAPGVRIRTAPGGATSAVTMQVRGLNSLNYNAQPLYVIDGVIMRDGNERGTAGINNDDYFTDTRIRGNGVLDINPADIDNLTVLKGASASALYGSDASSGVVLITTKKGLRRVGMGVDFNYQFTVEEATSFPKYQNVYGPGFDRARNATLGANAEGWVPVDITGDGKPDINRPLFESHAQFGPAMNGEEVVWWDGTVKRYQPQPDNFKNLYRRGFSSAMNVAVSNQIDRWSYRLSVSRNDYQGTQVGGSMARNTVNLNTSVLAAPRLKADLMLNYTHTDVHNRPVKINRLMSSWSGFFSRAENMSNFFNHYQTSAGYKWVPYEQSYLNPAEAVRYATPRGYEVMNLLWQQLRNKEDEAQDRLISSFTLSYQPTEKIEVRSRLGYDITGRSIESKNYNEYPVRFNSVASTGSYGLSTGRYSILYTDLLATYRQRLGSRWKLTGNTGLQLRDENFNNESISTSGGLVLENWFKLDNSYNKVLNTVRSTISVLKMAYLGVASISYDDWAFVELTGRQEYSSTLPPGSNGFFYPSINSAFLLSEKIKLPEFVDFSKIRLSYGVVGNSPPPYESNILYSLNNLSMLSGSVIAASTSGNLFGNNSIRPERKYEFEVGWNTRFFRRRVGFDLTFYRNRIVDQIVKLDVPSSVGADRVLTNSATLGGHGWELGIDATILSRRVVWNATLNGAINTTKLLDLQSGTPQLVLREFEGSSIRVVAEQGKMLGDIHIYPRKTDNAGNPIINANGLYVIDNTRYEKVGNLIPKVTGGFLNSFVFRNWTAQLNFDFSFGGQILSPALKYGLGGGVYESTLRFRDEKNGGLPYYIDGAGKKILLPNHQAVSPNGPVYHDGIVLDGVTEDGAINTTVVDAAAYYLTTYDWGNNSWNAGAVYDNSYIKLREASLSYGLPQKISEKFRLQRMRISLIGRNLFYPWRTLENIDPESTIGTNWLNQGIDESAGVATRSYGFSLNVVF